MNKNNLSCDVLKKKTSVNHFLLIMRTAIILLFTCVFISVAETGYTQNAKVTLNKNSVDLKEVLNEIENQTDYLFIYNNEVNTNKTVSVKTKNRAVRDVLTHVLKGSDIDFSMEGNHIILSYIEKQLIEKNEENTEAVQQQGKTITGTIVDAKGETIIGANIIEKGTSNGTITDFDGKFSLQVSDGAVLRISYIGYLEQEITTEGKNAINVTLMEDTKTLDELVVVGYGTMKKRDLTGSVSSIKMSEQPISTVSSVSQILAGKAAGLQVNTVSAQPGGGASYRIRGGGSVSADNSPLIVIDGFPITDPGSISAGKYQGGSTDNMLSSINPNDIESVEVLKDASSTAIYGSRAANGVILITTKKGASGTPKVSYSGTASVQSMGKKYETLNAHDFMIESNRYAKEEWLRANKLAPYGSNTVSSKDYKPRYTESEISNPQNDTDWFDAITRTGFQTQHSMSISGGNEHTKYLVSGNYFKQKGIIKNNNIDRFTGRSNIEHKLNKYVKIGTNLTFSRNNYDNVPLGSGQNENASIMVSAAQFNPLIPIQNEDGSYPLNTEAAFLPNPASLLEITDETITERFLGSAFIELEPIEDLKLKASFGIDRNYQKRKAYLPKSSLYGARENGKANIAQNDRNDYLAEFTANYTKVFNDIHSLSVLGGYSYEKHASEGFSAGNNDFITDAFLFNNIGAGATPKPSVSSFLSSDEMLSAFGRVHYSLQDRYLLTATLRADGSSNFHKDNRWGVFPSVALGWRFIDEDFMKPLADVISNGKLRLSYGTTGNSSVGYRILSNYSVGLNNQFGGVESQGVYISQLGNPNLSWETTKEWNLGLELSFVNNRINLTAELYNRKISDLLSVRNLQSYNEVTTIYDNIGETSSKGFELTINSYNIDNHEFTWTTDLTFSLYRDNWSERSPFWKPSAYQNYKDPIRGNFGYLSDGIIQADESVPHMPGSLPGQVKIKDIDGFAYNDDGSLRIDNNGRPIKTGNPDGKIDDADIVKYGNQDPGYILGLNNTFRWKNLDLNVFLYGEFDKQTFGSYHDRWLTGADGMTGIVNIYRGYNMPVTAKDVWTNDNQTATRPGYFQDRSSYGVGDYFMQDTWYIRCRNITLGYTFNEGAFNNLLSNTRIYIDVNNPFTFTNYGGLDPETDNSSWAYPNVRTFSVGLDITF